MIKCIVYAICIAQYAWSAGLALEQQNIWTATLQSFSKAAKDPEVKTLLQHADRFDAGKLIWHFTKFYGLPFPPYNSLKPELIKPIDNFFSLKNWGTVILRNPRPLSQSFPILAGPNTPKPLVAAQLDIVKHVHSKATHPQHNQLFADLKNTLRALKDHHKHDMPALMNTFAWMQIISATLPKNIVPFSKDYWAHISTIHDKPSLFFLFSNDWPLVSQNLSKVIPLCEKIIGWKDVLQNIIKTSPDTPQATQAANALFQPFDTSLNVLLWYYNKPDPSSPHSQNVDFKDIAFFLLPSICPSAQPCLSYWGKQLLEDTHKWHQAFPVCFALQDHKMNTIQLNIASSLSHTFKTKHFKKTRRLFSVLIKSVLHQRPEASDFALNAAPFLLTAYIYNSKDDESEYDTLKSLQAGSPACTKDFFQGLPNFEQRTIEAHVIAKSCAVVLNYKLQAFHHFCKMFVTLPEHLTWGAYIKIWQQHGLGTYESQPHMRENALRIIPILQNKNASFLAQWGRSILSMPHSLAYNIPLIMSFNKEQNMKFYTMTHHTIQALCAHPSLAHKLTHFQALARHMITNKTASELEVLQTAPLILELIPHITTTGDKISQKDIEIMKSLLSKSIFFPHIKAYATSILDKMTSVQTKDLTHLKNPASQ